MSKKPFRSPVVVIDALGIAEQIEKANEHELILLADKLDAQYHQFKLRIPNSIVVDTKKDIRGSSEFSSLRMNDMFIVYSENEMPDISLRYMVTSSILYQQLLINGFIPRGGLGVGLVYKRNDLLLGDGFINAYHAAEKRGDQYKDICAIQVSLKFFQSVPSSERAYRLLCWYEGRYFINPICLHDPDIGKFDRVRVLRCLEQAGTNERKLRATEKFLNEYEDYDQAMKPGSKIRQLTGWQS